MKKIVKGSIFYADLNPTIGSEQSGIRPVVVIQNDIGNEHGPTTIIAPISTKKNIELPSHVLVKQFDTIRPNSIVMLEQIRVIDKKRLKGYVGTIKNEQLKEIDNALMDLFYINK